MGRGKGTRPRKGGEGDRGWGDEGGREKRKERPRERPKGEMKGSRYRQKQTRGGETIETPVSASPDPVFLRWLEPGSSLHDPE